MEGELHLAYTSRTISVTSGSVWNAELVTLSALTADASGMGQIYGIYTETSDPGAPDDPGNAVDPGGPDGEEEMQSIYLPVVVRVRRRKRGVV